MYGIAAIFAYGAAAAPVRDWLRGDAGEARGLHGWAREVYRLCCASP